MQTTIKSIRFVSPRVLQPDSQNAGKTAYLYAGSLVVESVVKGIFVSRELPLFTENVK